MDLIRNPMRFNDNVKLIQTFHRPITSIVTTVLIIITLLYSFGAIKQIPCGEGVFKGLNRTFIHTDWQHIASNLFAFMVLSRIEEKHGSKFFGILLINLLLITTFVELMAFQFCKIPCSIGFSGIIFGLLTWELMSERDVTISLLLSIAAVVVAPSIQNKKASLIGHAIGALSGIILSTYYKPKI